MWMKGEDQVATREAANRRADLVDLTDSAVSEAERVGERACDRTEGFVDVELRRELTPKGEQLGSSADPRKNHADTNFVVADRAELRRPQLDLPGPHEPERAIHGWMMTVAAGD